MCLPGTIEAVGSRSREEGAPRISRRTALLAGAGGAAAALLPAGARAGASSTRGHHLQDLTHTLREGFPVYSFEAPERETIVTVANDGFYSQRWTLGEHSGTHVDAPGHFVIGGRYAPELTPTELIVPAIVIDISSRAAENPDARVTIADVRRFERRHGPIPPHAAVLMHSGWESRVEDPAAFKNAGPDGLYHFPGFGIEAAEWLLDHREIAALGVDTLSLDVGESTTFDVHLALLGADRYGIENVANLSRIPARGATVIVGVVPWEKGSGGPCRLFAHW
jgi:kynurenine formamidase